MSIRRIFCLATVPVFVALMSLSAVAADENPKAENQKAATAKDDQKEDTVPAADADKEKAEEPDIYSVPDGPIDALLKTIDQVQAFRPRSLEQYLKHRKLAPDALKAAAEKIMEIEKDKSSAAYAKAMYVLLQLKAADIGKMKPEQQQAILNEIAKRLKNKRLDAQDLGIAMSVTRALENSGAEELTIQAYKDFGKLFSGCDDEKLIRFGKMLTGSANRMQLVGKPLDLQGTKMDGTRFDVSELKDKVVLVDFWATWCGPCRGEVPNMKKNYDKYHGNGFEIVGVSIDRDRKALEGYLEGQKIPWIILHEADKEGQNPATLRYGIMGIPAMFLIGRDGNVISTHARGRDLNRLLAEQFGDSQAAGEPES